MNILFGLFVIVAGLLALAWLFARAKTAQARQSLRVILGLVGVILGIVLVMRGLAIAGIPLSAVALGLLGMALRGELGLRPRTGSSEAAPPSRSSRMSRKEAAATLGINPDATAEDIQAAYRDMMKRVHPDAGGSDALAAKVQEARDVLLGD